MIWEMCSGTVREAFGSIRGCIATRVFYTGLIRRTIVEQVTS